MRARRLVFAHRAGAAEAPENSLAAFRRAAALGVDGIETDLRATSDGLVVLHHNADLVLPDGRILPISAMESEELVVSRPDVPTLSAALAAVRGNFLWILELKPVPHPRALLAGLQTALRHQDAKVALASFSASLLRQAAAVLPGLPLVAVVSTPADLEAFSGISLRAVAAAKACAATLVAPHREVWAWTTHMTAEASALRAAGVEGLITDTPRATLHAFGAAAAAEA